jgi:dolichyl-phosphate beta-glucosyltransferase
MTEREGLATSSVSEPQSAALQLSMVIPAFNEERRLAAGVARLAEAIENGAIVAETTEFILVDDGSMDATAARARALLTSMPHVKVIRLKENRGKGAAVRAGVSAASAPSIIFADADMAIDPSQTPQFVEALLDADLAIGSRAISGASVDRPSMSRSLMNRTFNGLVNIITGISLNDTQCGFKAFRSPVAKLLFHCMTTERMAFDVEVLLTARRLGFSISQVAVNWLRVKGSHVNPLGDSASMLHDVLRVRRVVGSFPPLSGIVVDLPTWRTDGRGETPAGYGHLRELSTVLPVIRRDPGTYLVLLPLMDEAGSQAQLMEMHRAVGSDAPTLTSVSATSLWEMAPLTLSWDDADVPPTSL